MAEKSVDYLQSNSKRRLDIVGGLTCAAALLPIGAGAAMASMIDCREANPIFKQTRIGRHGAPFDIYKIRTLRKSLTSASQDVLGTFDPRASRLALFMREYGVDEIPQLYNVLEGTMSLVGVRPILAQSIEYNQQADPKLFDDWHTAYKSAKPGLLGPAQIYRHHFRVTSDEVLRTSMRLDIQYVEQASLVGDLKILSSTPMDLYDANAHVIENTDQRPAGSV